MTKILVIEDEASVRENLIELLAEEGYQVIGAQDGEEGVQRVWEELPDLVICDIMMPKLDGYGVLARVSRDVRLAGIPFLFLTARVAREDLRKAMELGADDYITKPFTRSEVLQAITTRLGRLQRMEALTEKKLTDLSDRIITDLPHELMTPLSVVIGFSEVLANQVDVLTRDEMRKLARDMHRSAYRLLHLIQNSLLYAEIRTLNSDFSRQLEFLASLGPLTAAPLLEMIENKAQLMDRAADLQVTAQPAFLKITEQHLEKIIDEILDNAFRFSKSGAQVVVEGVQLPDAQVYRLRIRDHGRGMTAEQIRRVDGLTPFDRHVYERQGLGMGLVLAKQLCRLYQGSLGIQSVPGEGTLVEVILPARSG